jgi:PAS domain S-box-containing protein
LAFKAARSLDATGVISHQQQDGDLMGVSQAAAKNQHVLRRKRLTWTFSGIVLLLALLHSPGGSHAQEESGARSYPSLQVQDSVTLISEQDIYSLGLQLEILEDKDGAWTIEDVTSPEISQQFVPSQEETPSFGFTKSAYWTRFKAMDMADEPTRWLLSVDANLFFIDVYKPASDPGQFQVTRTGMALPFSAREIEHPRFLFKLPLAAGEGSTIYVRLESESSMSFPMTIWSAEALAQDDLTQQLLNGFIYGVLLIMLGYNLILWLYLKDRSYSYYVLFLFFLLIGFIIDDGFAHRYLWPGQGRINAIGGQLFFVLAIMSALKFTTAFLPTKEETPRLHKAINILIVALALTLPVLWFDIGIAARSTLVLTLVAYILVVSAGVVFWRRGYRPAGYFLLAWLMLLTSMVIFVLALFNILPLGFLGEAGSQVGIVVLTLTLSLALADRISIYRHEKEIAQQELLDKQEEFAESLRQSNITLEKLFEERTNDLSFAQAQIETLFKSSPLAIGTAALDGEILSANATMARMLGYLEEELIGTNLTALYLDPEKREKIVRRLRTGEIVQNQWQQLRRQDGSFFYANVTENILEREGQEVILGVVDDISDHIAAEQALREKAEAEAVATERNRIASELHDSVTQALYSASLIAEALPRVWEKRPEEALRSLEELRALTQGAQAEMRTLLLELRPGELADRKLSQLLRQLIDGMSARTELPISLTVAAGDYQLPTEVQIAYYRIAQAALNNINKHARASRAWVNLSCGPEEIRLLVGDDGRGFNLDNRQVHQFGLQIMSERAEAISADLTIKSRPGQGTTVTVVWQAA